MVRVVDGDTVRVMTRSVPSCHGSGASGSAHPRSHTRANRGSATAAVRAGTSPTPYPLGPRSYSRRIRSRQPGTPTAGCCATSRPAAATLDANRSAPVRPGQGEPEDAPQPHHRRRGAGLDLLPELNMCTLHANSAREALVKMCTLPLLAGAKRGRRECKESGFWFGAYPRVRTFHSTVAGHQGTAQPFARVTRSAAMSRRWRPVRPEADSAVLIASPDGS